MRIFLLAIFVLIASKFITGQELLCNVQIESRQIAGVDQSVFDAMQKSIFEFMNNRRWSNINYKLEERIECTFIITIQSAIQGGDEFSGSLNVVLQRPIYGTSYNSVLLNMVDNNVQFRYTPFQAMEYADNTFSDNLTQILAFYAYMLIAMDLDTYSLFGGSDYYERANSVVQVASNSNFHGWQSFDGPRNRFHFVENMLNSSYNDLRKLLYEYHRKGLDIMAEDLNGGRTVITNSLSYFKTVFDKRPNLYSLQLILEAKRQEIISIYQEASPAEKVAMINLMSTVDPPNGTKYEAVNN
jgi:hypothetical protein